MNKLVSDFGGRRVALRVASLGLRGWLVCLVTFAMLLRPAWAREYRVTVAATNAERAGQVVIFPMPADAPRPAHLLDEAGRKFAIQVGDDGTARFIVPEQKAGERLVFVLKSGNTGFGPGVTVAAASDDLRVSVDGQPFLSYRLDRKVLPRPDIKPEYWRAGYVHSVFSPAGRLVTDDYPSNHVHHHGVWSAWVKTKFQGREPDFWNMQSKTGAEDLVALDRSWTGVVAGGFEARLHMVDRSVVPEVTALNESWKLTAYAVSGGPRLVRMFDLAITQTCATSDPVVLPEYHYGGFGFRGAGAWDGPGDAARFLTSEGITDRVQGNNSRARWCYLGGQVEGGSEAGTAVLGHPDNFRSPQPVRLHPNMPYFSFAPQQLGEFALLPGASYVARFRFIVTDGAPDKAFLDACWNGYAKQPVVTVEPR